MYLTSKQIVRVKYFMRVEYLMICKAQLMV